MQVQPKLFKHSFPIVLLQYFYDKLFCEDKQKQNPHTLQTTPPLKKKTNLRQLRAHKKERFTRGGTALISNEDCPDSNVQGIAWQCRKLWSSSPKSGLMNSIRHNCKNEENNKHPPWNQVH